MAESPVQVGEILAGKYRVEQILGQGGMGVVIAAWHLELEQRVAVKFLLPEFAENAEAAERFRREARAAVKIQSEHVARVVDVGTMNGGVPYMVMEFLDGHDLSAELDKTGRFSVEDAVDCVFQTCLAIAEAHSKGVIHRDLKPGNLFLTSRADGSRLVKVLDFGISKSMHHNSTPQLSLTRTSVMIGSPLYMSPEQLESAKEADERSDVWSIGVILFELLTGSVPFTGDTLPQLVRAVLTGKHLPIADLAPNVPPELSHVVDRCLDTNKNTRFANVAELADALAPFTPDGHRYSKRVRKVFSLSQTPGTRHGVTGNTQPGAPTATSGASQPNAGTLMQGTGGPGGVASDTGSGKNGNQVNQGSGTRVSGTEPMMEAVRPDSILVVQAGLDGLDADGTPATRPSEAVEVTDTVNSWGRTRNGTSVRPVRSRKGLAAAAVVLAVGGGGAAFWFGVRQPAAETSVIATQPVAPTLAQHEPLGEPAASAAAPEKPQPPTAATEGPKVELAGTPEAAQAVNAEGAAVEVVSPAAESAAPVQPGAARPHKKPRTTTKPAAPASNSKPDPFTDFGGRR